MNEALEALIAITLFCTPPNNDPRINLTRLQCQQHLFKCIMLSSKIPGAPQSLGVHVFSCAKDMTDAISKGLEKQEGKK